MAESDPRAAHFANVERLLALCEADLATHAAAVENATQLANLDLGRLAALVQAVQALRAEVQHLRSA